MSKSKATRRDLLAMLAAAPAALAMMNTARAEEATPALGKVLMPLGDATETMDTLYAFFRIAEPGFQVVVAGPEARMYHTVMHEVPPDSSIPWDITQELHGYHIKADVAFRDVNPAEYVGLFVSGGRAPEYLRYDKHLLKITQHFFQANKPVGSTCHGIEILSAAGVIRGKSCTTVGKCALDVEQGDGKYVDTPVIRQGNLITCRTWHDYAPFFRDFMPMLLAAAQKKA
jgi:protease I